MFRIFGVASVTSLSLGNDPNKISLQEIVGGTLAIGLFLIVPLFFQFNIRFFSNAWFFDTEDGSRDFVTLTSYILVACLLFCQITNIIRFSISNEKLITSKFLSGLVRGSYVKSEVGLKQAASYKVHKLVKNAYDLHKDEAGGFSHENNNTSHALALMNFTKTSEETESCGGILWAWKGFITRSLLHKEGMLVRTKIIVSAFVQVLGVAIAIFIVSLIQNGVNTSFESLRNPTATSVECGAAFDYDSCSFPRNEDGTYTGVAICDNMNLPESCIEEFKEMPEGVVDTFCDYFLNSNPYAPLFGDTCPQATVPSPNLIYAAATDSNSTHYCAAPIAGCVFDDGE